MARAPAFVEPSAQARRQARAACARPIRAFGLAAGCAVLLALGGCQRADADLQACAGADATTAPAHQPVPDDVRRCMEARGWRLLRPSLPPGANAWARVPPGGDALAHRTPPPEPGDRRPK